MRTCIWIFPFLRRFWGLSTSYSAVYLATRQTYTKYLRIFPSKYSNVEQIKSQGTLDEKQGKSNSLFELHRERCITAINVSSTKKWKNEKKKKKERENMVAEKFPTCYFLLTPSRQSNHRWQTKLRLRARYLPWTREFRPTRYKRQIKTRKEKRLQLSRRLISLPGNFAERLQRLVSKLRRKFCSFSIFFLFLSFSRKRKQKERNRERRTWMLSSRLIFTKPTVHTWLNPRFPSATPSSSSCLLVPLAMEIARSNFPSNEQPRESLSRLDWTIFHSAEIEGDATTSNLFTQTRAVFPPDFDRDLALSLITLVSYVRTCRSFFATRRFRSSKIRTTKRGMNNRRQKKKIKKMFQRCAMVQVAQEEVKERLSNESRTSCATCSVEMGISEEARLFCVYQVGILYETRCWFRFRFRVVVLQWFLCPVGDQSNDVSLSVSLCMSFVRLFENLNVIKYESGRLVKLLNASSKTSVCIKINLE